MFQVSHTNGFKRTQLISNAVPKFQLQNRTVSQMKKRKIQFNFNHSTPKNINCFPKLEHVKVKILPKYTTAFQDKIKISNDEQIIFQPLSINLKKESQRYLSHKRHNLKNTQSNFYTSEKKSSSINIKELTSYSSQKLNNTVSYRIKDIDGHSTLQPYFVITKKGKRPYNQDRYMCISNQNKKSSLFQSQNCLQQYQYYGVFDGHGGSLCAQFLKENLHYLLSSSKQMPIDPEKALKQSFYKAQQKFLQLCENKQSLQTSGSCAVASVIFQKQIYVAHVGDCKAILGNLDEVIEVTKDHKPYENEEKLRIIRSGGKIYKEHDKQVKIIKVFRQTRILPGNLNVSRTFGDIQVKKKKYGGLPGMIIADPQIVKLPNSGLYDYLLLASDGLLQGITTQEIRKIYQNVFKQNMKNGKQAIIEKFTNQIVEQALKKSKDNITVVVVLLDNK